LAGFNDVWGLQHSNGTEYAALGTRCGTSIYDLSDPTSPQLIAEIPGAEGIWRDLKSYGDYLYVVADQGGFGIQVIDMSDTAAIRNWSYLPHDDLGNTLWTAHNLYIDRQGLMYVCGSQLNEGGVVIFDLKQNDSIPPIVGFGPPQYAHDVFVNEARNLMFTSDIYLGKFTVISLDRSSIPIQTDVIASQETGRHFTHNTWTTDDGNFLFTTDERIGGVVECYDISNINDLHLVGRYAPSTNLSRPIIPHNVHVKDNHLIISYYSEGIKIVDISKPEIPVEVGSFDTNESTAYSSGAWGAFPFFNSDIILGSDISNGLFVLQSDYTIRCGYLQGFVLDTDSLPIDSALIEIYAIDSTYQYSFQDGHYGIGLADQTTLTGNAPPTTTNTVSVRISRAGYESKDTIINFVPDSVTNINFVLNPISPPVRFSSFEVTNINCENQIHWSIDSDINHSHYELQTSDDGENFSTIVTVLSLEKDRTLYSIFDQQLAPLKYYRLRQVDLDGNYIDSKIIAQLSGCHKMDGINVFPNPAYEFLNINSTSEIHSVQLFNETGTLVLNLDPASDKHRIDFLPEGIYFLRLTTDNNLEVIKFSKVN
ncbi:MAG: choice-of-anchor B family protein, partial [Saprospiraceae bacterium]|nr:choice-of-anchor B family protein [Saprospiraceae bacterium]